MAENKGYSLRARLELAAYQGLSGAATLLGAPAVPILRHYFARIDEGFCDYLGSVPRPLRRPVLWVHGVSMGESLVAIAFAAELKKIFPTYGLVFTSTHPDVIKNVKKRNIADVVAYFPLDTPVTMQRAFNRIDPAAVFVAETDFWPNFSQQCHQRKVPLMLINGRISSKIADFYRRARGLAEIVFGAFTKFLVQGADDQKRLLELGVPAGKILLSGNIKADLSHIEQHVDLSQVIAWQNRRKLVVFGSLHPLEFTQLQSVFARLISAGIAVLIAPRNLKFASEWAQTLNQAGMGAVLRSSAPDAVTPVMILDTMGELASVYGLAQAAVVGGSIDAGVGGHNPLEVIQQNVPLLMGPNYRNFADIVAQLLEAEAVAICKHADEFIRQLEAMMKDQAKALAMSERARQILENNRGALALTLDQAKIMLNSKYPS